MHTWKYPLRGHRNCQPTHYYKCPALSTQAMPKCYKQYTCGQFNGHPGQSCEFNEVGCKGALCTAWCDPWAARVTMSEQSSPHTEPLSLPSAAQTSLWNCSVSISLTTAAIYISHQNYHRARAKKPPNLLSKTTWKKLQPGNAKILLRNFNYILTLTTSLCSLAFWERFWFHEDMLVFKHTLHCTMLSSFGNALSLMCKIAGFFFFPCMLEYHITRIKQNKGYIQHQNK